MLLIKKTPGGQAQINVEAEINKLTPAASLALRNLW
jgi:hypothetical protein